jgi:hypothetical protein
MGGAVAHSLASITPSSGSAYTNDTYTTFTWADQAQQHLITLNSTQNAIGGVTTTSDFEYDSAQRLVHAHVNDPTAHEVAYVDNALGEVISRTEYSASSSNPVELYFYLGGQQLGDVGDNGPSTTDYASAINQRGQTQSGPFIGGAPNPSGDFDANYQPVGPATSANPAGYTVLDGESLQSIAAKLWGDSSLWWLIAQANGLNGTETLIAGQTLTIPTGVTNVHHNASTFEVYDPTKAVGNVQPQPGIPPPPKAHHGCGIFGQILSIIAAIVVIAVLHLPSPTSFLHVLVDAAGAAVANVVSQGVAILTGVQDGFSWKSLGLAVISAGVNAGLSAIKGPVGAFLSKGTFISDAVRGAAADAITQGVGVATGLQQKFDWAGVAAGAVISAVSGEIERQGPGHELFTRNASGGIDKVIQPATRFNGVLAEAAGAIAGAATRSAVSGTNFGDNLLAVLPDVIGDTIGKLVAGKIIEEQQRAAAEKEAKLQEQYRDESRHFAIDAAGKSYLLPPDVRVPDGMLLANDPIQLVQPQPVVLTRDTGVVDPLQLVQTPLPNVSIDLTSGEDFSYLAHDLSPQSSPEGPTGGYLIRVQNGPTTNSYAPEPAAPEPSPYEPNAPRVPYGSDPTWGQPGALRGEGPVPTLLDGTPYQIADVRFIKSILSRSGRSMAEVKLYVPSNGAGPVLVGSTLTREFEGPPDGFDEVWFFGTPQSTSSGGEETRHAEDSIEFALDMARTNRYSAIYFNRSFTVATGGQVISSLRPDVLGVLRQPIQYQPYESYSPGQDPVSRQDAMPQSPEVLPVQGRPYPR